LSNFRAQFATAVCPRFSPATHENLGARMIRT
jgi:hypothetical protein